MPREALQKLIQLAEEHDFLIASDECYSEIYPDEAAPPPAYCRLRPIWGITITVIACAFTASPNDQICRA